MFPFKFHFLVYWRELLLKICLKMKYAKENSVQWTDWDSNRERLKFDEVGKHSSSTKIILLLIISASYQENALPAIHIKITLVYQILRPTSFISEINFAAPFRVC